MAILRPTPPIRLPELPRGESDSLVAWWRQVRRTLEANVTDLKLAPQPIATEADVTDAVTAAAAALTAHVADTDPHGDRAYAASLVDDLSGVTNAPVARTNLGLGSAALQAASAFDLAGAAAAALATAEAYTDAEIVTHAAATDPHGDRAYADSLASNYDAAGAAAAAEAAAEAYADSLAGNYDPAGSAAAAAAASQPVDSDLTAISALSTTAYGRALLGLADQAALQAAVGYEEGTWTPTLTFSTPGDVSVSYSTQSGYWLRIGNLVFIVARLICTPTWTTASSNMLIQGLPGALSTALTNQFLPAQFGSAAITWPAGNTQVLATLSGTDILIQGSGTAAGPNNIRTNEIGSGTVVNLKISGSFLIV